MCWQMRAGLIEDGMQYERKRKAREGDGEADNMYGVREKEVVFAPRLGVTYPTTRF